MSQCRTCAENIGSSNYCEYCGTIQYSQRGRWNSESFRPIFGFVFIIVGIGIFFWAFPLLGPNCRSLVDSGKLLGGLKFWDQVAPISGSVSTNWPYPKYFGYWWSPQAQDPTFGAPIYPFILLLILGFIGWVCIQYAIHLFRK